LRQSGEKKGKKTHGFRTRQNATQNQEVGGTNRRRKKTKGKKYTKADPKNLHLVTQDPQKEKKRQKVGRSAAWADQAPSKGGVNSRKRTTDRGCYEFGGGRLGETPKKRRGCGCTKKNRVKKEKGSRGATSHQRDHREGK